MSRTRPTRRLKPPARPSRPPRRRPSRRARRRARRPTSTPPSRRSPSRRPCRPATGRRRPGGVVLSYAPGLHSWWVDKEGASQLGRGLGLALPPGRIYVGQAGATRWPAGRTVATTLAEQIAETHLGGRVRRSDLRFSLAAALFDELHVQVQASMLVHARVGSRARRLDEAAPRGRRSPGRRRRHAREPRTTPADAARSAARLAAHAAERSACAPHRAASHHQPRPIVVLADEELGKPRNGASAGRPVPGFGRRIAMLAHDQRITPNLWFDDQAEEAALFYVSIFKDSQIKTRSAGTEAEAPKPEGSVLTVGFHPRGPVLHRPQRRASVPCSPRPSRSSCTARTQQEVDHYWEQLSAGGPAEAQMCGWLKDKFGVVVGDCPRQRSSSTSPIPIRPSPAEDYAGDASDEEAGHRCAEERPRRHRCFVHSSCRYARSRMTTRLRGGVLGPGRAPDLAGGAPRPVAGGLPRCRGGSPAAPGPAAAVRARRVSLPDRERGAHRPAGERVAFSDRKGRRPRMCISCSRATR